MGRIPYWTALALGAALLGMPRPACADGPTNVPPTCCSDDTDHGRTHCPPPAYYSPFRYWTPALARAYDCCFGPKLSVYAPDRHPEIPPGFKILTYPCPPAAPSATLIPLPEPPASSRVR
jgi:hypothetical protein